MTECQGCGAWNDASRTLCVLCGTPLAEIDEWEATADPPPLPPLPDGGLASAMPAWLRESPATLPSAPDSLQSTPGVVPPTAAEPALAPLGPRADPRTFLTDDDFPNWLRELSARQAPRPERESAHVAAVPAARSSEEIAPHQPVEVVTPSSLPSFPPPTLSETPREAPSPPLVGIERRERAAWETALLVLLFLGVIIAALWALMSNGVFGPGW